jgi:ISXO2-like transposase domain
VRHWYALFREQLPNTSSLLAGTVQLDEAYGRGWSLLLAKQIGSRRLAFELHPTGRWFQRHQAREFIRSCVAPGSTVNTDGSHLYFEMEKHLPVRHHVDIHTKFEFSQTSEIEGMFGVFRTFIRRMYHHVTAEKIPEYVREFCARFSSPELFKEPRMYLIKTLKTAPLD